MYKNFTLTQEADARNWIHAAEGTINIGMYPPAPVLGKRAHVDNQGQIPAYLRDCLLLVFVDRPMVMITEREITEWYDAAISCGPYLRDFLLSSQTPAFRRFHGVSH